MHPIASNGWNNAAGVLKMWKNDFGKDLLLNGKAPMPGEVFMNPILAETFRVSKIDCTILV